MALSGVCKVVLYAPVACRHTAKTPDTPQCKTCFMLCMAASILEQLWLWLAANMEYMYI